MRDFEQSLHLFPPLIQVMDKMVITHEMKSIITAHITSATAIIMDTVLEYLDTKGLIAPPASSHIRLAPGPARMRRAVTGSRSMNRCEYGRTKAE